MRTGAIVVAMLLWPMPSWAQTCPGFPARGVQVIDALYDASFAQGTDDQRRQLTRMFIEQLVFDFPNDGWVWKSADPGRPPSKDSIARLVGGRLCNWDWQNGSTRQRAVQVGQIGEDITGQNPIPVQGVNRMVSTPQPRPDPQPQPQPQPPTGLTLAQLNEALDGAFARWLAVQLPGGDKTPDERRYLALSDQLAAIAGKEDALSKQLTEHDERPAWLVRAIKSPMGQAVIVAVSGILAGRYALPKSQAVTP